jgi:hypothetical protein
MVNCNRVEVAAALFAAIRARRGHAYTQAYGSRHVGQAVEAENILISGEPTHLRGGDAEPVRRIGLGQLKMLDALENLLPQLLAQQAARRLLGHGVLPNALSILTL